VVLASPDGKISRDRGLALCDQLHLPRQGTLYVIGGDPDDDSRKRPQISTSTA
jgi:hypothetical protein